MDVDEFDDFAMMQVSKLDSDGPMLSTPSGNPDKMPSTRDKIGDAVVNNFDRILDLAGDLLEVKKMQVQSDAVLKKMAEDRKALLAEAEAYAKKRNADTESVVAKMNIIRLLMKDFYEANTGSLTSEDFRVIITEAINQMGKIQ